MKNKHNQWAAAFALIALFTYSAIAATAPDAVPAVEPKQNIWLVIIPIIVPIIIAVAKSFVPKIPSVAIPIIAPILGALMDWLSTGTFGQGTIMGAIAGSAGVGLREIVDQLRKGNQPPTQPNQ